MVLCVAETDAEQTLVILTEQGETASMFSKIETAIDDAEQVIVSFANREDFDQAIFDDQTVGCPLSFDSYVPTIDP